MTRPRTTGNASGAGAAALPRPVLLLLLGALAPRRELHDRDEAALKPYAAIAERLGRDVLALTGDAVDNVPGVAKVDFIGEQEEKIYIELANAKLATMGVEPAEIVRTLAAQNHQYLFRTAYGHPQDAFVRE